jgi:hypothetical protein
MFDCIQQVLELDNLKTATYNTVKYAHNRAAIDRFFFNVARNARLKQVRQFWTVGTKFSVMSGLAAF